MNAALFCAHIVVPALQEIGSYSKAAERLVLGTAMTESLLRHIEQVGGPALGFFQMEPATHDDIWAHYLGATKRVHLLDGLRRITRRAGDAAELRINPFYAAAMCRIHYLRVREKLPDADDLHGMAAYWKQYYNTSRGRGRAADFIDKAAIIINI